MALHLQGLVKDLAVRRKTLGSVVLVIACALVASGCSSTKTQKPNGVQDLKPIAAFQRAVNAMQEATDVTARGALPVNGKPAVVETRFSGPNAGATVKSDGSSSAHWAVHLRARKRCLLDPVRGSTTGCVH